MPAAKTKKKSQRFASAESAKLKGKRVTYHITPSKSIDGWWAVKRAGGERATRRFETKKEAIEFGKTIAKKHHPWGQVKVHKLDGSIEAEYTYGNDPKGGG